MRTEMRMKMKMERKMKRETTQNYLIQPVLLTRYRFSTCAYSWRLNMSYKQHSCSYAMPCNTFCLL